MHREQKGRGGDGTDLNRSRQDSWVGLPPAGKDSFPHPSLSFPAPPLCSAPIQPCSSATVCSALPQTTQRMSFKLEPGMVSSPHKFLFQVDQLHLSLPTALYLWIIFMHLEHLIFTLKDPFHWNEALWKSIYSPKILAHQFSYQQNKDNGINYAFPGGNTHIVIQQ